MKAKDLRNKPLSELKKIAEEMRKRIGQLLIDKSLNKLSKPHLLRLAKRDLARVLTIIRENEKTSNR
ncbi:MAG: hypothetical protein KatS3mg093_057 [Candidatus Parcubacteria bacterium]|nr:MAG: hypothetical protein KatS3mg093_057 [Candidatus Parcubacteria bacterium]